MTWSNLYIGLPHLDLGRDRNGVDCWGLVHLVLTDHGMPVPSYREGYLSTRERVEIAGLIAEAKSLPTWSRVLERPEPLDVIAFTRAGLDGHVGIIVDHRLMLHVDSRAPSRLERYDIAPWSDRHPTIWRWVGERT